MRFPPFCMLRLSCLFFLALSLPAFARRMFHLDDSYHFAQQLDYYTLTEFLKVSAAENDAFLPGKALFSHRGRQTGALPGAWRPSGPRRATVAMQSKPPMRALGIENGTASAHQLPAMQAAMRAVGSRRTGGVMMKEGSPKASPPAPGALIRAAILAAITATSLIALVSKDGPRLISGEPDFGALFTDVAGLALGINGINIMAGLAGVRVNPPRQPSLAGLDVSVTMNVGRESGTRMPKEWAASGARLSLPLAVRFSDEPLDLGFPGEQALGGRYANRLECEGGSFVGSGGEVVVAAEGGAWSVLPSKRPGESRVNFFIDFPKGATRNDVTLPAGRVFFSCSVWDSDESRAAAGVGKDEVVETPSGAQLLQIGRIRIEKNDLRNLGGAYSNTDIILGRFFMQRNASTETAKSSVPQDAPPL